MENRVASRSVLSFVPLRHSKTAASAKLALSSFWARGRFRPRQFFEMGQNLGFDCFEISGIRDDAFYAEVHPGDFDIVSLHDPAPCSSGPAALGSTGLRRAGIVLASHDQERRHEAVSIAVRSIDVAADYGAQVVVLHLGWAGITSETAHRIKSLYLNGQIAGVNADKARSDFALERSRDHVERMQALTRSLDALVLHASRRGVRLGLENRPICEMPDWAEMQEILTRFPCDTVGYWHDTGHAETPALLGLTPHAAWLQAFQSRLLGLHLHDVVGLESHYAPGTGVVDWARLAPLVSPGALRVLEIDGSVSPEDVRAGFQHLRSNGWM